MSAKQFQKSFKGNNTPHLIETDVMVIIRSADERTESVCRKLIQEQGVPISNILTIKDAPFSATLRKSLETGIERGLPWTLCIDADVLLRPGSISNLLRRAKQQPDSVCEIQGHVLDKFFGGPRPAGNHLYRTSLLPLAVKCIPPEGESIRPETHALNTMKAHGFPWISFPDIVGLHDYEQYHRDIFRKAFVQAHKHQHLCELFLSIWRKHAFADPDYIIALKGFAKGVEHCGGVLIDVRQKEYRDLFAELNIREKSDIPPDIVSSDFIEKIIDNWTEPELHTVYGIAGSSRESQQEVFELRRVTDEACMEVSRLKCAFTNKVKELKQQLKSTKYDRSVARRCGTILAGELLKNRFSAISSKHKRIALFPAGKHTEWLLSILPPSTRKHIIVFDDKQPSSSAFPEVPAHCTKDMESTTFDVVILSTDLPAPGLRARAKELFGSRLIDLYEGMPPGPYCEKEVIHDEAPPSCGITPASD